MIARIFGVGSKVGHKELRKYFFIQNPYKDLPDIKLFPNWKLHGFLRHFANISPKAAHLPENNAVDEQTIGFQSRSTNKVSHKEKEL